LLCGLVEGAGLLLFQELGWLNWNIAQVPVTREILWVSPVVNLLLFGVAGVLMIAVTRVLSPRRFPAKYAVGFLVFLLFFDWLALTGKIRLSGSLVLAAGLAAVFTRWFANREARVFLLWRRTLPVLAVTVALAFLGIEGGSRLAERRALQQLADAPHNAPNLLVIVVDTLRADRLSAYGYSRATSPNIDRLAQQGVLFEKAISTASWTLPAHISMMTGRYPHQSPLGFTRVDPKHPTVAEALRARGYRTAAFSDNLIYFTRAHGFGPGFIRFEDFFGSWRDAFARTLYGRKFVDLVLPRLGYGDLFWRKGAEKITDRTLDWIRSDSRPFFAFLNYFDVHDPYVPPQPYRSMFSRHASPGGKLMADKLRQVSQLTPDELQGESDAYDGAIAYVDSQVGRLLESLEQQGIAEDTVVIVLSDHGEMFGEHQLLLHRNCLYRPVVHVPMILRWPGRIPAGKRLTQPVSIASLPATLAHLAGSDQDFPGPSLVELWSTQGPHSNWPLPLAEQDATPFEAMKHEPSYHGAMQSLLGPQWYFIRHEKLGPELYHWDKDPTEAHNAVATPEGEVQAAELHSILRSRLAEAKDPNQTHLRPARPVDSNRNLPPD
jgi:arylsulfatase A-like enzyme